MRSLRKIMLAVAVALAVPASSPAFLLHYSLEGASGEFALDIDENPQWTLTVENGATVYEGVALDSAKFSGELAVSFTDSVNITRNGQNVEATLKGKLRDDCGSGKITLKDSTNRVTFTIQSEGAATQACSGNV
jgi:hypothetical protein